VLPAIAQTTNTNCYTSYGQTYCRSTTQADPWVGAPDPNAFQRGYQNGALMGQQMTNAIEAARQRRAQQQATQEQIDRANRQREAGNMVAEGKCAEAKSYALREGDFELAHGVDEACAQAPALSVK